MILEVTSIMTVKIVMMMVVVEKGRWWEVTAMASNSHRSQKEQITSCTECAVFFAKLNVLGKWLSIWHTHDDNSDNDGSGDSSDSQESS